MRTASSRHAERPSARARRRRRRRAEPRRLAHQVPEPGLPVPGRRRARLRRAGVAVPRLGRLTAGFGSASRRSPTGRSASARARATSSSRSCGCSSRSSARCPTCWPSRSCPNPVDALFESMSGFSTTGASVARPTSRRSRARWSCGGSSPPGSAASGSSCCSSPCCRGCASAAARRCSRPRCPARSSPLGGHHPRDRAALPRRSTSRITRAEIARPRRARLDGHRPAHDARSTRSRTPSRRSPRRGFSTEARSIEPFAPATQWAIVVFMLVAGTNFAAPLRRHRRRGARAFAPRRGVPRRLRPGARRVRASSCSELLIAADVLEGGEAMRHGVFNTVSMMTTTGFASADFNAVDPADDARALRRRC